MCWFKKESKKIYMQSDEDVCKSLLSGKVLYYGEENILFTKYMVNKNIIEIVNKKTSTRKPNTYYRWYILINDEKQK